MGGSLDSRTIIDNTTHSKHSKCRSRHSLQVDQAKNLMDMGQEDLPVHFSEVLHTKSGPLCIPFKPPSNQACLEVPRSRDSSNRCIPHGLERMNLCNLSSRSPPASDTEENQRWLAFLLIAPNWIGQPWFLELIQMLVDRPLLLPQRQSLLFFQL